MGTALGALGLASVLLHPGTALAQAVNLGGGNLITPDGRTKTTVSVTGNHTKITTDTISQGTGFNSFYDFQEAAGQRVDLFVPDGAGNLINIVRNGAVIINGELNGFKNGEIGGNIFFSDSHGFILGKSGSINVGTLTVNTPTSAFLEGVIGVDGAINNQMVNALMRGEIPISADGNITIGGVINAKGGITLQGRNVAINARTGLPDGIGLDQRSKFNATVNTAGLVEGGALVSHGGVVSIVSTGQSRISGVIDVSADSAGKGGSVSIKSTGDIAIDGSAMLAANGFGANGAGGDIITFADNTLDVGTGAAFFARGSGVAAGGFIELSGEVVRVDAITADLASEAGPGGTLLFDPYDLIIGGTSTDAGAGNDYSVTGNIASNGASVVLQATNSITMAAGSVIDSRKLDGGAVSTGASGNVTIQASAITIGDGAKILAAATAASGEISGDILLDAQQLEGGTASVTLSANSELTGRNITLTANALIDQNLLGKAAPEAHASVTVAGATVTAEGAFKINATATSSGGIVDLPIGKVDATVSAAISIEGASLINAGSARFNAIADAKSKVATQTLFANETDKDAAVAISNITSTASSQIIGTARLVIANALEILSSNTVSNTVIAKPRAAENGASIAASKIIATSDAKIAGNADITSGGLTLGATMSTTTIAQAIAGAGGSTEAAPGTVGATYLADYNKDAATSQGQASKAASLAISDVTATSTAGMSSTVKATTGALTITTGTVNSADVTADSAPLERKDAKGVAIAINNARIGNNASLAQAVDAASADIVAQMNGIGVKNSFTTVATSGAGGEDVGIAGSIAANKIDTQSAAALAAGAVLALAPGGDLTIHSDNQTTSIAKALPGTAPTAGADKGVGASFVRNIAANRSYADLLNGASVLGTHDVSLTASADNHTETEAHGGATGGTALVPLVAVSLVNNNTRAVLGSGLLLQTTGDVTLGATQRASTTTKAIGDKALGTKASGGLSVAVAVVDDTVTATTNRAITAGGNVAFVAMGASTSAVLAQASVTGGRAADTDGNAAPGQPADVDASVTTQVQSAQTAQAASNVGDADQQQATDTSVNGADAQSGRSSAVSGGKIAVAAAIGVNVQSSKNIASVADGNNINALGGLAVRAINNTDGSVITDGNALGTAGAVDPEYSGGATVAVNHVRVSNDARLGNGTHAAAAINLDALKFDIAKLLANPASTDTHTDIFVAKAASGAGGARIGAAGAVALNILDTQSAASVSGGAVVNLTGGNLAISTDNRNAVTAEAKPGAPTASGADGGLGASAAVNVVANRSYAEILDGAKITGARDVALLANGQFSASADALAGAAAGKFAGVPVLALSLINNSTTARIGTGDLLVTTGKLDITATQSATETSIAKGGVSADKAAIGMSLALSLVNDHALATTRRSVQAAGDVTIAASGSSTGVLSATAGAKGGKPADDNGNPAAGDSNVDDSVTAQFNTWRQRQQDAVLGDAGQRTYTASAATTDHSAATAEGKFAGAAAAAVNVAQTSVTASADNGAAGLDITSGGRLTLSSMALTNGSPTADATVASVDTGASAAAAVNAVKATNTALLGKGTHSANGVSIIASKGPNPAALPVDTFATVATSGAGSSKIGVAGALALNLITADTTAEMATSASVNAGTGASAVQAFERLNGTASATPIDVGGAGGDYGVGASVALNILNTTTRAEIANGAAYQNGTALTVQASSDIATTTTAAAGAEGGVAVDAVLALASLNLSTIARVGAGAAMTTTGAVVIDAALTGANIANAKGTNNSDKYGVGASAALILGGGGRTGALVNTSNTTAALARALIAPALRISSSSIRSYDATATATAGGGEFSQVDETRNDATGGKVNSASTLQDTAADQEGLANGNKLSVAAAAGVVAAKDVVTASIAGVTLNIAGALKVDATNTIDMATKGSGEAVNITGKYGVSVGVGLGIIHNQTRAEIGNGTHVVHAGSTTVTATTSENTSAPFLHRLTAEALSGASAEKAAVAGAFALAISEASSTALIGDGVTIDSGGAVAVGLDNISKLSAKAWAGAALRGKYGVGASVATVVARNVFNAGVGADSTINAASLAVTATNRKVNEPTTYSFANFGDFETSVLDQSLLGATNYYAEAIAGAVAGTGAAEGSFAVMKFEDTVNVSIGRSLNTGATTKSTVNATGAVAMSASTDFTAKSVAGGISLGRNDGAGISSADIANRTVTSARLAANAVINAASFGASAVAVADIQTYGVTAAAGSRAGIAGVDNTVVSQNRVEALLENLSRVSAAGAVNISADNRLNAFSLGGAAAGSGTRVALGATVASLTVKNVTRAGIEHAAASGVAASLDAGGAVTISATGVQTAKAQVAAGAAAGKVALGAGTVIYNFDTLTEALLGKYTLVGQVTAPASVDLLASDATTLSNFAGALSGGTTAGAGAGVVVVDLTKNTRALVGDFAKVRADNIVTKANGVTEIANTVAGVGLGQTAGAAGAVSVVVLDVTTLTEIGASAQLYAKGNVASLANARNQIDTIAGTAAIGGTAGIGASAIVVDLTANTDSRIGNNAQIIALGDVADQAYVASYTPVLVAYGDEFKAPGIDPAKVGAWALPTSQAITAVDAKNDGMGLLTHKRIASEDALSGRGVIVNAATTNQMRALAVAGAGGGTGAVALSGFVPVVVSNTNASIGTGTAINQSALAYNAAQSVIVSAASDVYVLGGVGSVAGGGTAAGGAGLSLALIENNTAAAIGATGLINAQRDIAVIAHAREDIVLATAAGSVGGTAGLAGGASAVSLTNKTSATLSGTSLAGGNVDVIADDITRTALIAGGLAGAGGTGVGASLGLIIMDKTTKATITNSAWVTALGLGTNHTTFSGADFLTTRSARGVNLLANSNQSIFTLATAGGLGLAAGVSGVVSLELLTINTSATIENNASINTDPLQSTAGATQDVVVTARDSTATNVLDGGFAAGLYAGINGAVDVGVFRNNVSATIGDGAVVRARRDVLVSALSNKAGRSIVASGSLGAVAIAAGISIYNYGEGFAPGGASAQHINAASPGGGTGINSIVNMGSGQINNGEMTQLLASSSNDTVRQASQANQAKRTGVDLNPITTTGAPAGISARIGNSAVTAGGTLGVRSLDNVDVELTTGAASGGAIGLGAGVGVLTIATTNSATIFTTKAMEATNLLLAATTKHTLAADSYAGAFGMAAAAEADIAVLTDSSNTYANLGGGIYALSGAVNVNAYATRTARAKAMGAAGAGGTAVGVSYANTELSGAVEADIRQFAGQKTTVSSPAVGGRAASLNIHARASDTATSEATTGAGGLGSAGQSSNATALVSPTVTANIDGAKIYTTGVISARAEANSAANASSWGISLAGGLAAGGSFADAKITNNIGTTVSNGVVLDGGSVDIAALFAPSVAGTPNVTAAATGTAGAFIGVNATEANAVNLAQTHALFSASKITATGAVAIRAVNTTSQYADATGIVGGLLAAGSNIARAQSNTQTTAMLVDHTGVKAGSMALTATGADTNKATAVSGSGGVIAGSAAKAETSATSSTRAVTETSAAPAAQLIDVTGGKLSITAQHTTTTLGTVNSIQASIAGASGAALNHGVNATVEAYLGNFAGLRAADLAISARNTTTASDPAAWTVNSGSGGLINLPAGSVTVTIQHLTNAAIGHDADVRLLRNGLARSALTLEAFNAIVARQTARLDSGGAIATAAAHVRINVPSAIAQVLIGDESDIIVDAGEITLSATGNTNLDGRAAATTYGLAGAPTGLAYADYTGQNTVDIGTNVRLESSDGGLSMLAGYDLSGASSTLTLHTSVDLYNKTAIPLNGSPDAHSYVSNNSIITVQADPAGAPKGVRGADTITLKATRGTINTSAVGLGKDIYREILAAIASAISNLFGGDDISFDTHGGTTSVAGVGKITIDGIIETSVARNQTVTIRYAHGNTVDYEDPSKSCDASILACLAPPAAGEIVITLGAEEDIGTSIVQRVAELRKLLDNTQGDLVAKGAYQNEISFLENKLVILGLGTRDAAGNFVAGTYAGESDRVIKQRIADSDQHDIGITNTNLNSATGVVFVDASTKAAADINVQYDDATNGIFLNVSGALNDIAGFSGYGLVKDTTGFRETKARVETNAAAGNTAANLVEAAAAANRTNQATINTQTQVIAENRKRRADALLINDTGTAAIAAGNIANAQIDLDNALAAVKDNNDIIDTQRAVAATKAAALRTDLDALANQANKSSTADTNLLNSLNSGRFAKISTASTAVGTKSGTLASEVTASNARITTLRKTASEANSVAYYVSELNRQTDSYVDHQQAANAASDTVELPKTRSIEVPDTYARLGNVVIEADQIAGTGSVSAPGDASIVINNETSLSLKIGNLGFTPGGGRVLINGTPTTNYGALNIIASAGTVPAARVQINSAYNPDSALYYDKDSTLAYKNTRRVAPDIILKDGALIANPTGAVEIISNAGNIYQYGMITAKSVKILAKNGDYFAAYNPGFAHLGGDPMAYTDAQILAGTYATKSGIIANGGISISARYLNINTLIQSGIADWNLDLSTGTILTVDVDNAGLIGYSAAEIAAMKTAMTGKGLGATSVPSRPAAVTWTGVDIFIFIRGYDGKDRLQFSIDLANQYRNSAVAAGDMVYAVDNGAALLGAAYDARNTQFLVDGTKVRGGYIQLYGQILNTATTGGELKVLDGFGSVKIVNSTNIPVILQGVNTGDDASGVLRGTEGLIDITDVTNVWTASAAGAASHVEVKRTRYVRQYVPGDANGQVFVGSFEGYLDPSTGEVRVASTGLLATDLSFVWTGTGTDRSATYNPVADQRYVESTSAYYDMTFFNVRKIGEALDSTLMALTRDTASTVSYSYGVTNVYKDIGTTSYVTTDATFVANLNQVATNAGVAVNGIKWMDETATPGQVNFIDHIAIPGLVDGKALPGQVSSKLNSDPTLSVLETATYNNFTEVNYDDNVESVFLLSSYTLQQKYTTTTTRSLKADNPINVTFIGKNDGNITIASAGDIVLTDDISNVAGPVTICAGGFNCANPLTGTASIINGDLATRIKGTDIILNAAGSVGGVTWKAGTPVEAALKIEFANKLMGLGTLTANAGNGAVSIISTGDIRVNQISAAGDATNLTRPYGAVNLVAAGDIVGAEILSEITAPRVTLSAGGRIGSSLAGHELRVNTGYRRGDTLREFGEPGKVLNENAYYGLKALAVGNIDIRSTPWADNLDGSILVNQVLSTGGDVVLATPGRILDNLPLETTDTRTYSELLTYWNALGLVAGAENDAKRLAAERALENSRKQNYDQYWRIRQTQADNGAAYDPAFAIVVAPGSTQHKVLSTQFRSEEKLANPGYTDAQLDVAVTGRIQNYQAQQTSEYHELHSKVGGYTAAYDQTYTPPVTTAEKADMAKGSVWTERELAFSLAAGALKTITATNPVLKAPNVAGRSVSLLAGVGVGETVGADPSTTGGAVGALGVVILANMNPADLTDAQKVALAAAERSDLVLTLGQAALPVTATQAQIDAYNRAVTFGLHLPGALTVVALGTNYDQMTPVEQAAFDTAAQHLVSAANTKITVLTKRPLNFNATTALNVQVSAPVVDTANDVGIAYLASQTNAPLGMISVPGETRVKVIRNIVNAAGFSTISTGNLVLEAAQAGIGTGANPMQLKLNPNATVTARAQADIKLNLAGDALVDTIFSRQDIDLVATGSILNANADKLVNVLGTNVAITAQAGSIGSITNALNANSGATGGIAAKAAGAINLYGAALNPFIISSALAGTSIKIDGAADSIINGPVTATGTINFIAGGRQIFTANANVHSTIGDVDVRAKSLKILNNAKVSADLGRIFIQIDDDAVITGLTAGSNDRAAVSIAVGGRVFAGTLAGRIDISAIALGAGIRITAGLGIGDTTQANDNYIDAPGAPLGSANAITAVANPLRVLSAILDFNTAAGDLYVHTLGDVTDATLIAQTGHLDILGDGDFLGTLLGGITININVAGNLTLKDVQVATHLTLRAGSIDANITQSPSGPDPLLLTLTGFRGGVGNKANINVNAPAGLTIDDLRFADVNLTTTARVVSLLRAYITGSLRLTSPLQKLYVDNRTPLPQLGNNVQMHQPGFAFSLFLNNRLTTTDAFVVAYDTSAQARSILAGLPYDGISLVRDSIRVMRRGDYITLEALFAELLGTGNSALDISVVGNDLIIDGVSYPISLDGNKSAVNLGQL
ncbi:MAG: leukotoxin LktA family filamentous adhesin [Devosia sp.]